MISEINRFRRALGYAALAALALGGGRPGATPPIKQEVTS
jgi:hypothetical protein